MRLSEHRYKTISSIAGPLLFIQGVFSAKIGEVVKIHSPDGRQLDGEVLEITEDTALIEVFAETRGLDIESSTVVLTDSVRKASLSPEIMGRIFNGSFVPADGLPMFIPEKQTPITGFPINPTARASADTHEITQEQLAELVDIGSGGVTRYLPVFCFYTFFIQKLRIQIQMICPFDRIKAYGYGVK